MIDVVMLTKMLGSKALLVVLSTYMVPGEDYAFQRRRLCPGKRKIRWVAYRVRVSTVPVCGRLAELLKSGNDKDGNWMQVSTLNLCRT